MTSSLETAAIETRITITAVPSATYAFGTVEHDGCGVFIPGTVLGPIPVRTGDVLEATVAPNASHADTIPWFATSVIRPEEPIFSSARVMNLLKETGGSWTAAQTAETLLDRQPDEFEVAAARGALEHCYRAEMGVAKAMMYLSPCESACETWYTLYPDECDFADFED